MNPFAMVYETLWEIVENNPEVIDQVAEKNRIRFDQGDENPLKLTSSSTADFPELMLFPQTIQPKTIRSSSHCSCLRSYNWMLSTGIQETEKLFAIEWGIYNAHIDCEKLMHSLQWNNKPFVHNIWFGDGSEGLGDPLERKLAIRGFTCVLSINVEMNFIRSELKEA